MKNKTINDTIKSVRKLNKNIIDELYPSIADIVNNDEILKESDQVYSKKQIKDIAAITCLIKKTFKKLDYEVPFETVINMACVILLLKEREEVIGNLKDFNTYLKIAIELYLTEL